MQPTQNKPVDTAETGADGKAAFTAIDPEKVYYIATLKQALNGYQPHQALLPIPQLIIPGIIQNPGY